MDKPTSWNSLRNVVLGFAAVGGGLAGLAAKCCIEAPRTASWRLERYEASLGSSLRTEHTTGATATAVQ